MILPPRLGEAVDEPCRNKIIVGPTHHDGDGLRFELKDLCQTFARDEQYIDFEAHKVGGALAKLVSRFTEPSHDEHVLAIDPAQIPHRDPERVCRTDFASSGGSELGRCPEFPRAPSSLAFALRRREAGRKHPSVPRETGDPVFPG